MDYRRGSLRVLPVLCLLTLLFPCAARFRLPEGVNGGVGCAVCTAITAVTEQLSVVHNETFVESYERLCNLLPTQYQNACVSLGKFYIPKILDIITEEVTADVICHAIGLCYTEKGQPICHAFPSKGKSKEDFHFTIERIQQRLRSKESRSENERDGGFRFSPPFNPCTLPGVRDVCRLFERVFTNDKPLVDIDLDSFSETVESWRGTSWRGKDCNDLYRQTHPGVKPRDGDVTFDTNCNGIQGVDPETGKPYEELLCGDTGYLGVIVLGDSVAAHFHIPPEWLTASLMNKKVFENAAFIVENEMDWPQLSLFTAYMNISRWPVEKGNADSIYMRLWQRNHCNHRDYQNLGKNGADSFIMNDQVVKSLARTPFDQPALVFYSSVGNDVCNHWPNYDHMTTPEQMHTNVLKTLMTLDTQLPKGSHVFLVGMVDGRVLYDTMHNRIHPIGQLRGDVTYSHFYDFFNCLQISPCFGWMNSNESVRNFTFNRMTELTDVLRNIPKTAKFDNFDVFFFDCPFHQVIQEWQATGGKTYELIEPVDGFHPNLIAEALIANASWALLESTVPHVLGKVNPHNQKIKEIFKDQGGY